MGRTFRIVLALIALLFCGAWIGCGGGGGTGGSQSGGGSPETLSGTINATDFQLAAGQTRAVTSDLFINATGKIDINGTLLLSPGVSVGIFARGPVHIGGAIMPAPAQSRSKAPSRIGRDSGAIVPASAPPRSNASSRIGRDSGVPACVIAGASVTLDKGSLDTIDPRFVVNGQFQTLPGQDLYIAVSGGSITISADVKAGDGSDAPGARPSEGQGGGNIFIGATAANIFVQARYKEKYGTDLNPAMVLPNSTIITAKLTAGNGGAGWNDEVGKDLGTPPYKTEFDGGVGGLGGNIDIDGITTRLTGATVRGGAGGRGGDAGPQRPHDARLDGAGEGHKGLDEDVFSGYGRDGGSVKVGGLSGAHDAKGGSGGYAGSVRCSPGNGAPGKAGGRGRCFVGFIGEDGKGPDGTAAAIGNPTTVTCFDGARGGDTDSQSLSGGKGGWLELIYSSTKGSSLGLAPRPIRVTVQNFGNGGKGFNGCPKSQFGTNGGDGGLLILHLYVLPAGDKPTDSFNGGGAGDGMPPGVIGKGGSDDNGNKFGADGKKGTPCGCAAPSRAAYSIVDLGEGRDVHAINHAGQVVGDTIFKPGDPSHAFLWDKQHGIQDLGVGHATGINDHGTVVGYTYDGSHFQAFTWDSTKGRNNLAPLMPAGNTVAYAINNNGKIVGWADVKVENSFVKTTTHACLWSGATVQDLGAIAGVPYTSAGLAINDSDVVVGYSQVHTAAGAPTHAACWPVGASPIDLGTVANLSSSVATGINANGLVCGYAGSHEHAILWQNNVAQDLGLPSGWADLGANGIGLSGDMVGQGGITNTLVNVRAFVYTGGSVYDLNNLVQPKDATWILESAVAINDCGQIVGTGIRTIGGVTHGFLLTVQ
jgi:probable HAF family extracellular repeat protein